MNLHPRRDTPVPQNQQTPTAESPAAGVFHSSPFMSTPSHATVFPSHPTLFHNGRLSCSSSTTAPFSAFRCRCGMVFLTTPLLQAFWTALLSCSSSTTAPFSAFLCRCGIAFLTAPLLQAFWTALPSCSSSTTAAFPAFLCRCGSSPRKMPAHPGRCRRKLFFTVIFQNQPELSACL